MSIREILNLASVEKEQEEVKAEADYESGLFGKTAREVKDAKRSQTMDLMRMGIQGGLNQRAVGAGVLLGQGLRALTGKESQEDLDLRQRQANREQFYHELQSSSPVELLELSKKLISSEDAQSRSMGMSLMSVARSDIAAATAQATAAGKVEPKNINAGQVKVATGVLNSLGLQLAEGDTSMQNYLASEYNRLAAQADNSAEFHEKSMAQHMADIFKAEEQAGNIQRDEGNFFTSLFRDDQVKLDVLNQEEAQESEAMLEQKREVERLVDLYK